ncbi:MAG: rod-binding protein [Planctomycetota bacterium]
MQITSSPTQALPNITAHNAAMAHYEQSAAAYDQRADKLRPTVKQWVGQTFFGTMLKQARGSVLASEDNPFNGGRGGQAFGSLLDQRFAEMSTMRQDSPLVDAITEQILGQRPTPPTSNARFSALG